MKRIEKFRSMDARELEEALRMRQNRLLVIRRYPKVPLENFKLEGNLRKEIARIKTVITEREGSI